jgi:hypothetical protein
MPWNSYFIRVASLLESKVAGETSRATTPDKRISESIHISDPGDHTSTGTCTGIEDMVQYIASIVTITTVFQTIQSKANSKEQKGNASYKNQKVDQVTTETLPRILGNVRVGSIHQNMPPSGVIVLVVSTTVFAPVGVKVTLLWLLNLISKHHRCFGSAKSSGTESMLAQLS